MKKKKRVRLLIVMLFFIPFASLTTIFIVIHWTNQEHDNLNDQIPYNIIDNPLIKMISDSNQTSEDHSVVYNGSIAYPDECINSVQGIRLITDSSGVICDRYNINKDTHCCNRSHSIGRFTCDTCNDQLKCCSVYEYCISCCMKPNAQIAKHFVQNAMPLFKECSLKCRTSSRSIKHGNEYKDTKYKYCHRDKQFHFVSNEINNMAKVFKANGRNINCDEACKAKNLTCHEDALKEINNCDTLKKHFPCENGCEKNLGADQPAYVDPLSGDPMAGKCLYNSEIRFIDCQGSHANTIRLCMCIHQ